MIQIFVKEMYNNSLQGKGKPFMNFKIANSKILKME